MTLAMKTFKILPVVTALLLVVLMTSCGPSYVGGRVDYGPRYRPYYGYRPYGYYRPAPPVIVTRPPVVVRRPRYVVPRYKNYDRRYSSPNARSGAPSYRNNGGAYRSRGPR